MKKRFYQIEVISPDYGVHGVLSAFYTPEEFENQKDAIARAGFTPNVIVGQLEEKAVR